MNIYFGRIYFSMTQKKLQSIQIPAIVNKIGAIGMPT
jgi:hypothetical protein